MSKYTLVALLSLLVGLSSVNAASVDRYAYDELGRLTAVRNAEDVATESYRYDGVGNIVEQTIEGATYHLSYDRAHQLKSVAGPDGLRTFVYDKAGRLTSEKLNGKPVVNYTYGYLDKVIAVERNGEMTRFDYDAQGMLVGKQLPDGSYERWTWDGMALVARGEERYINESHITGGLPLVSQTSEGVQYHQYDHLGTTVTSYSPEGDLVATYETTVFGRGELEESRAARFTGKPYDADLGAYVFPYRNYDPEAARWLSADPAGFPDGPNNHYYAAVPTMGVDPWGLLQLSASLSQNYPNAAAAIESMSPSASATSSIQSAISDTPPTAIDVSGAFTQGQGPTVNNANLVGANGSFKPGSNELQISESVLQAFEDGSAGAEILLESTVGHEATHWFDDQDGNHPTPPDESGNNFENSLYGMDVDTLTDALSISPALANEF